MKHIGEDGYRKSARAMNEALVNMKAAVQATPGVRLVSDSDLSILSLAPYNKVSVSRLSKAMDKKGWSMFTAQNPTCISICLGDQHTQLWPEWVADLRSCLKEEEANLHRARSTQVDRKTGTDGDGEVNGPYSATPMALTEENQRKMAEKLRDYIDRSLSVPKPKLVSKL